MAQITDHHQYLFLGKITDSLSPEEELELRDLFARDPAAVQAYEELLSQLPPEQVAGAFHHLNTPGFWKDVPGEIHTQQAISHTRKLRRVAGVLSIAAVLTIGAWWLMQASYPSSHPATVAGIAAFRPAPHSVELKLADGSTIDLSKTKGILHKDQLVLQNDQDALSYTTASGTAATTESLNSITVPATMDYKLILPDGSEIWLNSVSSVRFPEKFAAGKREISITGEAYCRIAKNPAAPFIIHLPGNTVQVTGTEFNVDTYDTSTVRVALVTGGVNLVSAGHAVKLDPGYQGISTNGRITQQPFVAEKVLSWRQGIFYFDGAGLDEISTVLGRWFGIRTHLDEPALAHKRFVGALYKHKPLASFLDNLKAISHINSYLDDHSVLHFTTAD